MNSKQIAADLAANDTRRSELAAELESIRGPKPQLAPPDAGRTGWQPGDPLEGASEEYRRIALEGSPDEMVELTQRRDRIEAEISQLLFRRQDLKRRLATAIEEDRKKAAPGDAKKAAKAFSAALDKRDAARVALQEAEEELSQLMATIRGARELVGPEVAAITPLELRRLWTGTDGEVEPVRRRDEAGQLAFVRGALRQASDLLAPPSQKLLERVAERFRPDHEMYPTLTEVQRDEMENAATRAINECRTMLIGEGDLRDLEDDVALGDRAIKLSLAGAPRWRRHETEERLGVAGSREASATRRAVRGAE